MTFVIVNADYRITIPKKLREDMNLKPGMKFDVESRAYGLDLIPMHSEDDSESQ